jgi:hypothetical protein
MGIFMKNQQAVLTPQNPPLGIFPHFCVQGPTTLVLKEKVWSWSGVSALADPDVVTGILAMRQVALTDGHRTGG